MSLIDVNALKSEVGEPDTDLSANKSEGRSKLTLRTPDEILALQFDDSDIILGDRLFAKGQSLVIAGQGGLGKSRLLLQLVACVISGRYFLTFRTGANNLRWLILQTQNNNRRLKADLQRIRIWLGENDWLRFNQQVTIHTIENDEDGFVSLDSLDNQCAIHAAIVDSKPDIICIDPLDEFAVGDLNKDADMKVTLQLLSRICRKGDSQRGITIVHHAITGRLGAAKATGYERAGFARNSKTLQAWTRGQINLVSANEDDYDRLVVACGKCSNGREFQTFAIQLNPETMIYECDSTFDAKEWAAQISKKGGTHKKKPSVDEVISLFRNDAEKPRTCLLSAVEFREKFRSRGWDDRAAAALRDQYVGEGKLDVFHGAHNQKLVGLPAMVEAFRKLQTEKNSILEDVPLVVKPRRKKRQK